MLVCISQSGRTKGRVDLRFRRRMFLRSAVLEDVDAREAVEEEMRV
jgi:hypothetical protein